MGWWLSSKTHRMFCTTGPPRSQAFAQGADVAFSQDERQGKRLDFNCILRHYRQCGAEKTFMTKPAHKILATGEKSVRVYVMPKNKLDYVVEKPADMQSMLALALAENQAEVENACADLDTGTYHFQRHTYLRRTLVSIFLTTEGKAVDEHKHYVDAAGFSEPCPLFTALWKNNYLAESNKGPKSSRADQIKHVKHIKLSEGANHMLSAPAPVVGGESARPNDNTLLADLAATQPAPLHNSPGEARSSDSSLLNTILGLETEDRLCLASTQSGFRCRKKRTPREAFALNVLNSWTR